MSTIVIKHMKLQQYRVVIAATERNTTTVAAAACCSYDVPIFNRRPQRQAMSNTRSNITTNNRSFNAISSTGNRRHHEPTTKQWKLGSRRMMMMWSSSSSSSVKLYDYNTTTTTTTTTTTGMIRTFASSRSGGTNNHTKKNPFENTFGVTFTISPDQALEKFIQWAQNEQGLNTYIMNPTSAKIVAAYCPVWSFDLNMRFILSNTNTGRKRLDWKPDIFQVYGTQSIVHLPGLSAYAGYTYRRTLIDALHNTTLVFMYNKVVPFGAWMLRDMKMAITNEIISVIPDPWNAPQGRALAVVKEGLELLTSPSDDEVVRVQAEVVSSRRVYMPTYVIQYNILGVEYQAFVSGCDDGAAVSGVSHKVFDMDHKNVAQASANATGYLSTAIAYGRSVVQVLGGQRIGALIVVALQIIGSLAARLLLRLPLIGAIGGAFVGFRKIVRPWMDNRTASAEWERQREREASLHNKVEHVDDFTDTGTAQRYFTANREQILRNFAGTSEHGEGSYNWYSEWETWARQQWEQQQQQGYSQQQQQGYSQQQQQTQTQKPRQHKARPRAEYVWDFDPNDPYSVLGIKRGATTVEVSAAFRKQMMLHHPDTKSSGSEAEKARAIERSKLITSAYQTIKSQMKR